MIISAAVAPVPVPVQELNRAGVDSVRIVADGVRVGSEFVCVRSTCEGEVPRAAIGISNGNISKVHCMCQK
ncbi:hypothetical protein WN55_06469 [Dufourea novaeangliae]|uniref:Uncharacterized protein n=1 Tax=Dufourea novaeangliae TaxID=178035 RepID=A0A154PQM5_DUFNO|nr:hypothetical protein WN55_06469 [Dufourea novaeangliae]